MRSDMWDIRLSQALRSQRDIVIWQTWTGHGMAYLDIKPGAYTQTDHHGYCIRKAPTAGYQDRILKALHTRKWMSHLVHMAHVRAGQIVEEYHI